MFCSTRTEIRIRCHFFLFFRDICDIVIYEDLINTLNDIKIVIREIF